MNEDLFSYAAAADVSEETAPEPSVLSVQQVSVAVKQLVEGTLGRVSVEGEVGTCSRPGSGHMYLTLKDQTSSDTLSGMVWRSRTVNRDLLQAGNLVVAHGRLTTFGAQSCYQLDIERVEPAGLGKLLQLLEERKKRLAAEGLFDVERKKPIPFLPARIGVVTSPSGAVIQDMLHRIDARCPRPVLLWPAVVQGGDAPAQIAAGIAGLNALPSEKRPDVIIVARGGGSVEDLMAFNEEIVVRAVAASVIPVVSGVGHEPDTTLCDYAADLRAPTPTAAAEAVTPVREDLLYTLDMLEERQGRAMLQHVRERQQLLDMWQRLIPQPQGLLSQMQQLAIEAEQRLSGAMKLKLRQVTETLTHTGRLLESLTPQGTLKRGYIYATTAEGDVVGSAKSQATEVTLHFHDGKREATLS